MTIGIFLNSFCEGGIERVVARLIPDFASAGHNVVILSGLGADYDVIPVIPSFKRVVLGVGADRGNRLEDAIRDFKIELCIIENYMSPTVLTDCKIINSRGIPYIVHFHGVFSVPFLYFSIWMNDKEYFDCYSRASALIVLSHYDEYFFRLIGCNAHYFPNPVEDVPVGFKRCEMKHEILWLARFDGQKFPIDAIEIFRRVLERIPDAKLVMVGGLGSSYGKQVAETVAADPKLSSSVKLPGFSANVWEWYSRASVFLSTSAIEGFPCTFMEAAAAGVPIVGYDLPYVETVSGNNGFIAVKQGDVDAAAEAICRLFENDEECAKAGAANRVTFEWFKSFDQMAAYGKLFDDVKAGVRVGPPAADAVAQICLKTLAEHAIAGSERLKTTIKRETAKIKKLKRSNRHKNRIIAVLVVIIILILLSIVP
jgi:glycosyltransferase involved in cell wall biosynthesis